MDQSLTRPDVAATYTLCHMGSGLTDIDGQISKSCIYNSVTAEKIDVNNSNN